MGFQPPTSRSWLKPWETLLCQSFRAAQPLKRACGWLYSWKHALCRILFSVGFKCRLHDMMLLHTTSSVVFDQTASCLIVIFWVDGFPEEASSAIRDVLVHQYQSYSLKMPEEWNSLSYGCTHMCVCVCVFSPQVLNFQGEKCSAWANVTNNFEMFICQQTSVESKESKINIITLEKCYGIWGSVFSLQA